MQDDNQEHMQYLLTKEAYENWQDSNLFNVFEKLFQDETLTVLHIYLKEHGLPLDSEIKD